MEPCSVPRGKCLLLYPRTNQILVNGFARSVFLCVCIHPYPCYYLTTNAGLQMYPSSSVSATVIDKVSSNLTKNKSWTQNFSTKFCAPALPQSNDRIKEKNNCVSEMKWNTTSNNIVLLMVLLHCIRLSCHYIPRRHLHFPVTQ